MMRSSPILKLLRLSACACIAVSAHAVASPPLESHDRTCHYLPQFKALYKKLPKMSPSNALDALHRYQSNPANDNADNVCEAMEVERLMTEREVKLVYLTDGSRSISAQSSMHCDALSDKTMKCNGISEDGTVFPLNGGIMPKALSIGRTMTVIRSDLPGSELVGAYSARLGELQDGKPVRAIPVDQGKLDLHSLQSGDVLMVIFKGPKPWAYRKFVWYFD